MFSVAPGTEAVEVMIALGSNAGKPYDQVMQAIAGIAAFPETNLLCHSSLQETPFWGNAPGEPAQAAVINAVVQIQTRLSAFRLLALLLAVEQTQGRVRDPTVRYGARTVDCDMLLYGHWRIASPILTIPHPGIKYRDFVLTPLLEIAPEIMREHPCLM